MSKSYLKIQIEGEIYFLEELKAMINIGTPKNDLKTMINRKIIALKKKL